MKYLYIVLIGISFFTCNNDSSTSDHKDYPKIKIVKAEDNYFDTIIKDEYRHLENLEDSSIVNWFKAQDNYSEKFLSNLTTQNTIVNQIKSYYLKGEVTNIKIKYTENGYAFFLRKDSNEIQEKLFFKENLDESEVELFNPLNFNQASNREYTINYIQPSWNGKYVLISLGYDGVKGSEMIIIDIDKRKSFPEIITNADPESYLGISWLPDSSGFLYLYLPNLDPNDENYMLNSSTVLYRLGEDPNKRHIVFSSSSNSEITNKNLPIAKILSKNDKYIIGYKASSENYWASYYAEITDLESESIRWKPLYTKEEKVYADYGYFMNDSFMYISGKKADNRTISSFSMDTKFPIETKVLVREKKDEVITSLYAANNALYYSTSKYGVEAFFYEYKEGQETKIKLPKVSGTVDLYSPSNESRNIQVSLDGWSFDYTRYIYKQGEFSLDPLSSHQDYPEFNDFVIKELEVSSHDGVKIPLSLIYRKDMVFNGNNPAFIYSYGAYGDSITPFFSPIFLYWVQQGGLFIVPHIRGGGEKGDSWHQQGMKTTKFNSWKDIIACTEYLIKNNYTSKDKTVLYSSSAGTIATGMAMVERPDLYEVFVADVPMLNPLRSEQRKYNATNYLEYGTIKDSIECMGLIKMDPYVNLKPNTGYPATLVISGFNDARIDAWIPGKFVARLQEYSTSNKPVLLDVIYDAGHEGGDTEEELIALYSKIFAFAFWQTNHKIN